MCKQQFRGAQRRVGQLGVTLVESVVAVGIAGVLAAIGVPSMSQFHSRAAVDAQVRDLGSALRRARSEAMTRGELVTVCALDPASATAASPTCLASGKDWSAGWIVFVDRGQRGEVDDSDLVIRLQQASPGSGGLTGTQRFMTYRATGELLSLAAHFRALPPGQPVIDKALPGSVLVCVNKPGKARTADGERCQA